MKNTVVYLLGYPAAGKYTIGQIVAGLTGAVLVDNHLIANPVLAVVGADGVQPVPRGAWDLVGVMRSAVFTAIEEFGPPDTSYVLTNVLADSEEDRAIVDEVRGIASKRGATFVPVLLTAPLDVLLARVGGEDRRARHKLIDPRVLRSIVENYRHLEPDDAFALRLDSSAMAPDEAARRIVDHALACARLTP